MGWCRSAGGHDGEVGCWKATGWGLEGHREETRPAVWGGGWRVEVGGGIHRKQLQPHLRTGAGWLHRENLPPSEPPPQRLPHHTHPFLQLKDQPGDPVPQRFTLRSWNVAAGSPTWILLEFPQSRHPTTTTIVPITATPASRKPACSQKLSRLPSKWPHLPATNHLPL